MTYALHQKGSAFETDGPGLGYLDIYTSRGRLLRRLEHGDWLNAPWGVALAPLDFGCFSHDLLVRERCWDGPGVIGLAKITDSALYYPSGIEQAVGSFASNATKNPADRQPRYMSRTACATADGALVVTRPLPSLRDVAPVKTNLLI